MINSVDRKECCGCSACVQVCPNGCLTMVQDSHGFFYPAFDPSNCIECGLCVKVCQIDSDEKKIQPKRICAAKHNDDEIRKESSSGGVFSLIAEYIIDKGGVVFGAKFSESWEVVHDFVETKEELQVFRGSKYVQSNVGDSYQKVRQFLNDGRIVLFSGTPCQTLGLKKYLGKEYDNLVTLEVFCHGVPSPGVWKQYVNKIRSKTVDGKNTVLLSLNEMPIKDISFRDKTNGWKKFGFVVRTVADEGGDQNSVLSSSNDRNIINEEANCNSYMRCFIKNVMLRPSCYNCQAKSGKSGSDFALADFWGIDRYCHSFSDDLGVTLLYTMSDKACQIVDSLRMVWKDLPIENYKKYNRTFVASALKNPLYDTFWDVYEKSGIDAVDVISPQLKASLKDRFFAKIRQIIKKIIFR